MAAAAVWSASRYGMTGPAVHPRLRRQVPATDLVGELLEYVTPALEDTGDLAFARKALEAVLAHGNTSQARCRRCVNASHARRCRSVRWFARKLAHGTGAEQQRRAMAAAGVRAVIDLLSWAE